MKNILIAMGVAVAACGLAAAQQPMGGMETPPKEEMMKHDKKEMKKIKMTEWKGTVQAVDAAAGKITVTDKKGMTMVMPVTAETKIMRGGKMAALADLTAGETVHLWYEGDMNMPMVRKIKVKKAGMKKERMEKMGKPEPMEKKPDNGGMKK